jgi:Flp pilus assembly protein TadG
MDLVPTAITIGGGNEQNPWDWNNIDVRFVKVESGTVIYDKAALQVATSDGNALAAQKNSNQTALPAKAIEMTMSNSTLLSMHGSFQTVGVTSQVHGVWAVTTTLHNNSANKVYVVPYCLVFDDNSRESAYTMGGWQSIQDTRSMGGPAFGQYVPSIPVTQTYISPIPEADPITVIDPYKEAEIDVFAEDGGSWSIQRSWSVSGSRESDITAPVQSNRKMKDLIFLQVPANTASLFSTVPSISSSPFLKTPNDIIPSYRAYIQAMNAIPIPSLSDVRWISVPVIKDQIVENPAHKVTEHF